MVITKTQEDIMLQFAIVLNLEIMRQLRLVIFFAFIMSCNSPVEAQIEGIYIGEINGATATLTLKKQTQTTYSGTMQDGYQNYVVSTQIDNNCMKGNAMETSLNIEILISGCFKNNQIEIDFDFSKIGVAETQKVLFIKENKPNNSEVSLKSTNERDLQMVGLWKQEQLYNSGYGSNYFGGSFTQKIIFYADGSLADGGSQSTISGNDYSGNSTSGRGSKVSGVSWFTKNKHLYIKVFQNGQSQTADAGKYYIEDGKLLITDQNGNKTLLIKIQ